MNVTETILTNMHVLEIIALCLVIAYGIMLGFCSYYKHIDRILSTVTPTLSFIGFILDTLWIAGVLYFLLWFFG